MELTSAQSALLDMGVRFVSQRLALPLSLNTAINWVRRRLGLKYKPYSLYMKQNVKRAVNYVNSFEELIALHTRKQHCDGVICGHIHTPAIKPLAELTYTIAATGLKAAPPIGRR